MMSVHTSSCITVYAVEAAAIVVLVIVTLVLLIDVIMIVLHLPHTRRVSSA
jgi:hypothetical protein